jgi:transposase
MYCRYCGADDSYKNGLVKGKQRYKCRHCKKNFQKKDGRTKESAAAKQMLAVVLYAMSKASYNFMAKKIFKCSPTTIMNWVKKWSDRLELPEISGDIKEMEFDEMWHFIGSKKTRNGYLKRLIVARGKPSHGLRATVILQRSKNFTTE